MEEIMLYKSYSDESDIEAVKKVINRNVWWIKGEEIKEFEQKLAEYTGVKHGIAFNSGTSGLFAVLLASNVKDGEVILPSFTFIATADAVVNAGGKPVFADIEYKTYGISSESVRQLITDKTKAIIAVHYLGDICNDIKELTEIAKEKKILLIEDAAHAIGALSNGKKAGQFGDSAMFSFSFNKVISTGEGGAIVTDSDQLNKKIRLIRSHGQTETKDVIYPGFNLRMSSMTAALGLSQLKKIDILIQKRNEIAEYYNKAFKNLPIKPPSPKKGNRCVYQRYSILLESKSIRDALKQYLKEKKIPTANGYHPIHNFSYFKNRYSSFKKNLPITEDVADRMLVLPFHSLLTEEQINYIIKSIKEYFK
jgi:perosamine synthetase